MISYRPLTRALARRFAADARLRGWTTYSILTGVVVVGSLVVSNVPSITTHGLTGLIQRICIVAGWVWIVLLAARLLCETRMHEEQRP